ncbi:alpha-L-fucosidase 3 [Ziziphus jujuba]|uniref:Alpha-L-fucosidase 3 n=1 Tax=Ziziphus jujuba TaxID=326968 RepID=A0A6P4ACY6_ZIZJJ|nr:alpha-L-fucosidase 3 [Ziziphus jujuba]
MGSHMLMCGLTLTTLFSMISVSMADDKSVCNFPAIFNFGDSNSDTGGLSAAFGQAPPPHGESYFHHPAGRYCDGRVIIDFIAQKLGLPLLSAYLDSVGTNFSHGANFATAGSTVRPQNTTLRQGGFSPISLDVQFVEFCEFQNRTQTFRAQNEVFKSLLPPAEYFNDALYTFDIGQNDLTSGYFSNMSVTEVKAYIPDVLLQLSNTIRYIYARGGRYFWIHNTGPVGCLPYVIDRLLVRTPDVDAAGCATPFNEVAQVFNEGLKQSVMELRKELPLAALTYVDVYTLKYEMFTNPSKHGFVDPLRACCGHGGKYNYNANIGCGAMKNVNGTQIMIGKACKDPGVKVIWDGVHFTQAANKFITEHIETGAFSDPPIPLKMACLRNPPTSH